MKQTLHYFQTVFTTLGGVWGYFLGGFDGFLIALTTFVVLDYLTGVLVAIVQRKLSSEVGFRGICKKVLIFALWLWATSLTRSF